MYTLFLFSLLFARNTHDFRGEKPAFKDIFELCCTACIKSASIGNTSFFGTLDNFVVSSIDRSRGGGRERGRDEGGKREEKRKPFIISTEALLQ